MPHCPKCNHAWTTPKKQKVTVPYHMTGPNQIHPQGCDKCGVQLNIGDAVIMTTILPFAFCLKCHEESKRPTNGSISGVGKIGDRVNFNFVHAIVVGED